MMSKHGVSTGGYTTGRCADTHPPLKLGEGWLHGGSCWNPNTTEADVLIGLDTGMQKTSQSWPWTKGVEFLYPIQDMCAPTNAKSFDKLVNWMIEQLKEGKRVHVGCIGGHGRTGTVIAAIVRKMLDEKDAISWVRKNYCDRAVESKAQIEFLHEHYGITKVKPSKGYSSHSHSHKTTTGRYYSSGSGISKDAYRRAGLTVGGYLDDLQSGKLIPDDPYQTDLLGLPAPSSAKKLSPIVSKRDVWTSAEDKPKKKAKKTVFKSH